MKDLKPRMNTETKWMSEGRKEVKRRMKSGIKTKPGIKELEFRMKLEMTE